MTTTIRGVNFHDGQPVNCFFSNGQVVNGFLHIRRGNKFYICHNADIRHGSTSPNMFGCQSSWVFEYSRDTDSFSQHVINILPINTDIEFKEAVLDEKLEQFLNLSGLQNARILFLAKIKPFDFCKNFEISDKTGFIKMSGEVNTPYGNQIKTVEIKLARFIKKIIDTSPVCKEITRITDKIIEDVHNDLVSYQEKSYFEVSFYEGESILEGYKLVNYSKSNKSGTLHKSCMTNKLDYLKLYTQNPEQVKLAYLKSRNGIEARCLVWQVDGEYYYDRIYTTMEWLDKLMKTKLNELGYTNIYDAIEEKPYIRVKLTTETFDEYPYLDNFKYFHLRSGSLFATKYIENLPYKIFRKLDSTSGGYEIVRKYEGDD